MPSFLVTFTACLALVAGVGYQFLFKEILFNAIGLGRVIQDITDFRYTCRRIRDPRFEGCEDMWLDDEKRLLYAACSKTSGRAKWTPSMTLLNAQGRSGKDHLMVLDIDNPGEDGLYNPRDLKLSGYTGALSDKEIDLHGFSVEILDEKTLRFFMVNHRPPMNGSFALDASTVGANSTVEIFDVARGKGATEMKLVRTVFDENIFTPNRVAATGDGGFVVSNDKSRKVGLRRELFPVIGGGSVSYCPPATHSLPSPPCHLASGSHTFTYPNGLTSNNDHDKLVYVPSSFLGRIWVFKLTPSKTLEKVAEITAHGMPIDNLQPDKNGAVWGAGFPDALAFVKSTRDAERLDAPSTVWKIEKRKDEEKGEEGWVVEKVLEDREARVLGGATVAVHDIKTGRIFTGGNFSPYISVCEPK